MTLWGRTAGRRREWDGTFVFLAIQLVSIVLGFTKQRTYSDKDWWQWAHSADASDADEQWCLRNHDPYCREQTAVGANVHSSPFFLKAKKRSLALFSWINKFPVCRRLKFAFLPMQDVGQKSDINLKAVLTLNFKLPSHKLGQLPCCVSVKSVQSDKQDTICMKCKESCTFSCTKDSKHCSHGHSLKKGYQNFQSAFNITADLQSNLWTPPWLTEHFPPVGHALVGITDKSKSKWLKIASCVLFNDALTGTFMLSDFMQKQSFSHTDASLCIPSTKASASTCLTGIIPPSSVFECRF